MKVHTRVPIFNYSSFASTLLTDTKSLEIKFRIKYFTAELLFEFESILAWCASHPEIQSLYISCFGEEFFQGFEPEELKITSEEKLQKLTTKLSTIARALTCLPQTVIMDLKGSAKGIGLEFSLASDIRIAKKDATFCFNHLALGLTPICGLFSFQKNTLNQNILRSLLLSGKSFNVDTLNLLGGYCETDISVKEMYQIIFKQAPVARVQAKLGLYGQQEKNQELENNKLSFEKQIFNAVTYSKDYQKENDFLSHTQYKDLVAEKFV